MSAEPNRAISPRFTQPQCPPVAARKPTDLEEQNRMLDGRDRLLETITKATNVLLTLENFDVALNTALEIIGEGIDCDFVIVLENVFESSSPLPRTCDFVYEWAAPDFLPMTTIFGSKYLPAEVLGLTFLEQYLLKGTGFGGPLDVWDEPLRSLLASVQIQSAYAVPIRVKGQWWGALCLDYCRAPVQVSAAEMAVLITIADCIGSAIQRDRSQQERTQIAQQRAADLEEYNRLLRRRDRLLEASAKATNVLLTTENFDEAINAALIIIVEGAGCDRLNILEGSLDDSSGDRTSTVPDYHTVIYEWAGPGIIQQMAHLEAGRIPSAGIEAFLEQHYVHGDGFGGLLEEWDEPLRSAFAAVQVKSSYSVPIRVKGQWWGVLCLDYCQEAIRVSPAEVAVLRAIADCIGSAIQRERTQKMLRQGEQERFAELAKANDALQQSLDILAGDRDLDRFVGHILRFVANQFDSPLTEYWVYTDPERSKCFINLSCWQGKILRPDEQPGHPGIAGLDVLPERRPLFVQYQLHIIDPEFFKHAAAWYFSKGVTHFLTIPLYLGNAIIGTLDIFLPENRPFPEHGIGLAHALAEQLTLAIELTRLAEEAQQAALLQERTRMAREIHDTLAQAFGGISMQLQAANYFATTQSEKAQTHLHTAQTLAQSGLAEARRSVWTLYLETSEYEDPAQAIAKFIQQTASGQSTGQAVPIHLEIDGDPYRLHPDLGLNLLRIAQESITNALRHAQAQTIQIRLRYSPETLQLIIRDDGCGFEPQPPGRGFGLAGMQQRVARLGATWQLTSPPGQGTTITVTLANPEVL